MLDKRKFKHITHLQVRNYEVDWQGVVHNSSYQLYFEVGRFEYLKALGLKVDMNEINTTLRFVIVRSEIDYKAAAHFDDPLVIYTRISSIKNSSFVTEGIIENSQTGKVIAENMTTRVWLDALSGAPMPVPSDFRRSVQAYEGVNCEIFLPSM